MYQRETWYAQRLPIVMDVQDPADDQVTIGFRVDRVFGRSDLNERDLRLACSLLRENVNSHVSVIPTTLSVADWLADQRVTWEILPRGEATFEKVVARLKANPSSPRVREMQDRYQAVDSMHPGAVVVGEGEFSRYFGFKFRDDLVVLENLGLRQRPVRHVRGLDGLESAHATCSPTPTPTTTGSFIDRGGRTASKRS